MLNKKGSALMQVLLITIVVATIATAMLRIAISRTTTAANTVRTISAKNILEGCNAEVQSKLVRELSADPGNNMLLDTCQLLAKAGVTECLIAAGGGNFRVKVTCTPVTTESGTVYRLTYDIDRDHLNKL